MSIGDFWNCPRMHGLLSKPCARAFDAICQLEALLDLECGPILGLREAEILQWSAAG